MMTESSALFTCTIFVQSMRYLAPPFTANDVSAWDSCVMEGYLQLRGGRMGTKGYKQKYFRMRDTALVQYKKQSKKGKYGKGSGKILKVRDPSGL